MAYKKENASFVLNDQIRRKRFDKVYTFYGEEEYLKKQYTDKLCELFSGGDGEFSVVKIDDGEYTFSTLANAVETVSFGMQSRIVVLRNISMDKIGADTPRLKELFADLDEDTKVIFYYDADFLLAKDYADERARRQAIEKMSAFSAVLEFFKQTPDALAKWVRSVVLKAGARIDEHTALYLIERCGSDMGRLKSETDKLALLKAGDDILQEDIDEAVSKSIEANVFALSKYVVEKNPSKVFAAIEEYKAAKEAPQLVLYNLAAAFSEMCAVKSALCSGITDHERVMADFGISKGKAFFVREYFRICGGADTEFFAEAMRLVSECDRAFKQGENASWERLEILCMNLMNLPRQRKR